MNPLQVGGILLSLAGFQGLFLFSSPLKKIAAWVLLQSGLALFLLGSAPALVMVPKVLALMIGLVTFSMGTLLCLFCRKPWKPNKNSDGHETLKRSGR